MIEGWEGRGRNYWASFENVFGERFETRNPTSPNVPAVFRKLDGTEIGYSEPAPLPE